MNGEKERIVWEPVTEYGEVKEFWKKKKKKGLLSLEFWKIAFACNKVLWKVVLFSIFHELLI